MTNWLQKGSLRPSSESNFTSSSKLTVPLGTFSNLYSDPPKVEIHPSAVIDPKAQLGKDVSVGPFTSIAAGVAIGDGCVIGPNVLIETGTTLGKNCQVFHGASLGGEPQIVGFPEVSSSVEIGEDTVIREYVTVHRGGKENAVTRIGSRCMLMAYAHVAHDCIIGDEVILVNGTGLSGHIVVEDQAFVSGIVGVHQHVRIGRQSMIGGVTAIRQDVLPYSLVEGPPPRLVGVNVVGLKRRGVESAVRSSLKKAFRFLKQDDLNTTQALDRIEAEIEMCDEILYLMNFIRNSSRGITK